MPLFQLIKEQQVRGTLYLIKKENGDTLKLEKNSLNLMNSKWHTKLVYVSGVFIEIDSSLKACGMTNHL